MDHVVYLDANVKELEMLLSGLKSLIIRGAAGRKLPYGRVDPGDMLYFINNNAEGLVHATGIVKSVFNSAQLTAEESAQLVSSRQEQLQLTPKQTARWAGKRYLVLVEVSDVKKIEPFRIDKRDFGNMDDWLLVERIERVKVSG
jgi:hypothetical protein